MKFSELVHLDSQLKVYYIEDGVLLCEGFMWNCLFVCSFVFSNCLCMNQKDVSIDNDSSISAIVETVSSVLTMEEVSDKEKNKSTVDGVFIAYYNAILGQYMAEAVNPDEFQGMLDRVNRALQNMKIKCYDDSGKEVKFSDLFRSWMRMPIAEGHFLPDDPNFTPLDISYFE